MLDYRIEDKILQDGLFSRSYQMIKLRNDIP